MATSPARAATGARSLAGLDPITFEVIRHRLWAINDDQGRMAARLSGSFIVFEGYDFNAALVTADGRGLYCGMYILQHGATIDEFVRRILAEWAPEEIREGDMFFTNDPWWGALHANDGILVMPIFWEGELVAWSGIAMHDEDVGSPVPGSFVAGAADRFGEAPLFPGVKMVVGFAPRPDVLRAYLRNSRTSELNALNMRARVAALRTTYGRIQELIGQYGLAAFLAAQEGIIEYVERVVRARLREIPDGSWFGQIYHDHDGTNDEIYRMCARVTKCGDGLAFDLAGTSAQAPGPINCARPAMEGAIMGVILTFLCYDLPWAIGALRNIVEINSLPATLNNARDPAAVSMASVMGTLSTQDVVSHAFAKMLLSSEAYRGEASANWSPGFGGGLFIAANPAGEPWVGGLTDAFAGAGGARTHADGIDSGGIFHSMGSRMSNAETVEARVPALQLYRRELRDGGGAGRFRGGAAVEFASIPHKLPVDPGMCVTFAAGVRVPAGRGLSGGHPGAATSNVILRGANVAELFAAGRLPASPKEIRAESVEVQLPKMIRPLGEGDVLIGLQASGAGYGDPLRRDPARVAADVREGLVSETMARSLYGVVLGGGELDAGATDRAREELRRSRLAGAAAAPGRARGVVEGGVLLHPVCDTVDAVECAGRRLLRCSVCHQDLGDYPENPKRAAATRDIALAAINPHNADCLEDYVLREYYCPGCATTIAADVAQRDEAMLDEVSLGPGAPVEPAVAR
jgi:N-methylhydantoinase B/oxoprolinase/acetone carboxylase alpha subunit